MWLCTQHGNALIASDLVLNQEDYRTEELFHFKLKEYISKTLTTIRNENENVKETLFVFPELIGAWLALTNQNTSKSVNTIMLNIILKNPFLFLKILLNNIWLGKYTGIIGLFHRSIFQLQSKHTLNQYFRIFSSLSKEFSCNIIAGSAYLPKLIFNNEKDDIFIENYNSLYNTTLSFSSEGKLIDITYKHHAVHEEISFLDESLLDDIHCFTCNSFGNIGVLICADSWYPDCYEKLFKDENCIPDIIAVPSFSSGPWENKWEGYSGEIADDVKNFDVNASNLTLHEAWRKFAIPGRIPSLGVKEIYAVNTFYRGNILGMKAEGSNIISHGNFSLVEELQRKD